MPFIDIIALWLASGSLTATICMAGIYGVFKADHRRIERLDFASMEAERRAHRVLNPPPPQCPKEIERQMMVAMQYQRYYRGALMQLPMTKQGNLQNRLHQNQLLGRLFGGFL